MKKFISNFPVCAECAQKEKRADLKKGHYYCSYAVGIYSGGIITDDVDSTGCVRKGCYKPINSNLNP